MFVLPVFIACLAQIGPYGIKDARQQGASHSALPASLHRDLV